MVFGIFDQADPEIARERGGAPTPSGSANLLFGTTFAENCMTIFKNWTEKQRPHEPLRISLQTLSSALNFAVYLGLCIVNVH